MKWGETMSCSTAKVLLAALTMAAGCTPEVIKDDPIDSSAGTIALFAPDSNQPCNSVMPFPTDLLKDPATGRLNIPYCPADSPEQQSMKTGLRTLDGYAQGVVLTTRFSRAVDGAFLGEAVKLIEANSGQPVPVTARFDPTAGNSLYIQPSAPLREKTRYFAVITTDLKDASGAPVVSDRVFTFAKSATPLIDEKGYSRFSAISDQDATRLEALRRALAPMFAALEGMNLPRSRIAVAWPFTTQSGHTALAQLAGFVGTLGTPQVIHENAVAAADHPLLTSAGIPTQGLCHVHSGRVTLNSLLTASGTFGASESGAPLHSAVTVEYLLTTPKRDVDCATPWAAERVAVFVHGLARCKNDALALASSLGEAGFAVLSLDGPRAGARTVGSLGDQDLDGCADQPATPEFIALPGTTPNPFAIRDHLREWALEIAQIASAAKAVPHAFAGLTTGGPAKVVAVGHSWGGMAASLAGSLGALEVLAVNASSAELGAVFKPALRQAAAGQLLAAGVNLDTPAGQVAWERATDELVAAFRWAMEPGDPLYAAFAFPATSHVLAQVVSSGGTIAEASLHASQTQRQLALAFGRAPLERTNFELKFCDDARSIVGALLKPCVADPTAANYPVALAQTVGLQRQLVTFVATATGGTPVVCNPDPTAPCN
jgi:pimeloyl-ACP methyl ester carboxylesterase